MSDLGTLARYLRDGMEHCSGRQLDVRETHRHLLQVLVFAENDRPELDPGALAFARVMIDLGCRRMSW